MSDAIPITPTGYHQLKKELDHLIKVERASVVEAIAEAREHGDLKENAEYHAAKERQGFIEGRIQELNGKLSNCNIIEPEKLSGDKVVFAATVTLLNLDTDEEMRYQIVGEEEADLDHGKISFTSPIARAIIGKHKGDDLVIPVPKGSLEVEILEVEFI